MNDAVLATVRSHPFFDGLPADRLARVAACGTLVEHAAGHTLARSGTPADACFLILDGRVALELTPPAGPPFLFAGLSAGEVFGWSWLFPPHLWQFDARVVEPARLLRLDGACLRACFQADPVVGYALLERLTHGFVRRLADTRLQSMDVHGTPP